MKKLKVLILVVLANISPLSSHTYGKPGDQDGEIKIVSLFFIPKKWDKETNLATIDKMAREAAANGAKIIVTSEGALDGYLINYPGFFH